jgi:hypothetical protein
VFGVLFSCLISVAPAFAGINVVLTKPGNGTIVSGPVTLTVATAPGVSWCNYYVDGNYFASTPPNSISWDSSKVANGIHTIAANAYSSSRALLGISSVTVSVLNPVISVSPASALKITAPTAGSQISGSILIAANQPAGVTWENFYIDGNWIASSPPFSFNWNSKQISNGTHTISVTSYGNSGKIGSSSLSVTIANGSAPLGGTLPTPTPIATAAPTIAPTAVATPAPSKAPTTAPTIAPTAIPTKAPTIAPTAVPTAAPTKAPTAAPTVAPTVTPTSTPTKAPTTAPTIAPTPVPTVVPTKAPTIAPSNISTSTPTASPTPLTPATYFVSTTGSDGNNGMSLANAWRTIQHAVNTMPSGESVQVESGTYAEHVTIVRDGVTVQADPNATSAPVVQGFTITADNVTVDGFEITFQNNSTPGGYGVYLHGASNAVVENNYIHDLCHDGVRFDSTDSSDQVLNNRIVHAQESGITIDGAGNLIQGNEIWGTYQHPSVLGGIYAVCTNDGGSGSDADGIRFFGSNHIIRSNYIHDIEYDFGNSSLPNPNPHTDCFQTWGESGETTANILIDRNWCDWPSNGSQGAQGEVGSIEALDGPVGTLTFQNNVFQDMIRGLNATQDGGQTIGQLNFYNNTFDHLQQEAIVVDGSGTRSDNIENNIFFDISADGFISYSGGETFVDNVFYSRAGAVASHGLWWGGGATPPFLSVNPLFVSTGSATGVGANYNLCVAGQNGCAATSTIGHSGATLSSVLTDYNGNPRSGGSSIGAYQISQ